MFCVWCGSKIDDDASFCPECGKEVWSEDTKQQDSLVEKTDIVAETQEETPDENLVETEMKYTPSDAVIDVLKGIRAGIIVLIVLLIIFIIMYYSRTEYYFDGMP